MLLVNPIVQPPGRDAFLLCKTGHGRPAATVTGDYLGDLLR